MNLESTVNALYRIWKQPGKAEYRYIIYRGDEPIAKFKVQSEAELAKDAIAKAHLTQLYAEMQEKG